MTTTVKIAMAALALAMLTTTPLAGQAPDGKFVRDVAAGDDLEKVVVESLPKVKSTLAKIFKGKAKSRLRQVVIASAWQSFTRDGDAVRMESDAFAGDRALTARPGVPVNWKRHWPNGKVEPLDVRMSLEGNTLTYRFIAEDGERVDAYSIDPTGNTLTQTVTLESSQLSSPIRYRLVYRRERSTP